MWRGCLCFNNESECACALCVGRVLITRVSARAHCVRGAFPELGGVSSSERTERKESERKRERARESERERERESVSGASKRGSE